MASPVLCGIDVGTYSVKVVIATPGEHKRRPLKILGRGISESRGLRHGYIINGTDAVRSIKAAVKQAEEKAGIQVQSAQVAIGGVGLESVTSVGATTIESIDGEITERDVTNAIEAAEAVIPRAQIMNRRALHSIPLEYRIDGRTSLGDPQGLKGTRLEAKVLFVTCFENHISDLIDAVEEAGIEVRDISASPIAASYVTTTKTQRMAGCVLANFGAETLSLVVFEDDRPISLQVFPTGSTNITNDIALGLQIPIEDAEKMKRDTRPRITDNQKRLDTIISERIQKMLSLVQDHLKKIGCNGLLPAGIIITGGGSGIGNVEDLARGVLALPSRRAELFGGGKGSSKEQNIQDATWAVTYGLCIIGRSTPPEALPGPLSAISGVCSKIWNIIKKVLP